MIEFDNFRKNISKDFISGKWIFRGQSNISWGLDSSYHRFCKKNQINHSIQIFFKYLSSFTSSASNLFDNDISKLSIVNQIALAQHYGLPTPFLDWSYSPYIALYFAARDCILTLKNNSDPIRIWAFKPSSDLYFNQNIQLDNLTKIEFGIIDTNLFITKRIKKQQGCFTFQGFDGDLFNKPIKNKLDLRYFDIIADKFLLLSELKLMGITSENLFDDLESVAEDIKLSIICSMKEKIEKGDI